jgi:hypothetical protein
MESLGQAGEADLRSRLAWLLLALILVPAAWLRLNHPLRDPWWLDEGVLAQLTQSLSQGGTGTGLIKANGILPSTSSFLAPALAAVLVRTLHWPSLMALRIMGGALGTLSCALLFFLGQELGLSALGLLAAALYAFFPLAVDLGRMGFYHHLGAALAPLACLAVLRFERAPTPRSYLGCVVLGALAPLAAYWLVWIWLPVILAALLSGKLRFLAWGLPLLVLPLALSGLLSWHIDPASFWLDLAKLSEISSFARGPQSFWRSFPAFMAAYPVYALGFIGLAWAFWPRAQSGGRRGRWLLLFAAASSLEVFRQRSAFLSQFPYPLILVHPWTCLGLAGLGWRLGQGALDAWDAPARRLAFLALALGAGWLARLAPNAGFMRGLSVIPADGLAAAEFVEPRLGPGEQFIGVNSFDWLLPGHPGFDINQACAYWGLPSNFFFPRQYPPSRFLFEPSLKEAKFLVLNDFERHAEMGDPGAELVFLEIEKEGWPLLWQSGQARVYGNPAFGVAPAVPAPLILADPALYAHASMVAQRLGRPELAVFAARQARSASRQIKDEP